MAEVARIVPEPRRNHRGADGARGAEEAEGGQAPAHLEGLVAGVGERMIADLGAQIVDHDFDRTDFRLDGSDTLLDAFGFHSVQQKAGSAAALALDGLDQLRKALCVASAAQHGMVPGPGKSRAGMAADAGAGADNKTNRFHLDF